MIITLLIISSFINTTFTPFLNEKRFKYLKNLKYTYPYIDLYRISIGLDLVMNNKKINF